MLECSRILPVKDDGQRYAAEEVAVHFDLRQGIAELTDSRSRGIVDQHFFGTGFRCDVVDHRHPLVEEVPAACLKVPAHPVARNALPFEAGDELTWDGVQISEEVGERLGRRLL